MTEKTTTWFTLDAVPEYLRESEFYRSFGGVVDGITIPKKVCKFDLSISTTDDVSHLLSTMRFWRVTKIPQELVNFVVKNPNLDLRPTLEEFTNDLRSVTFLGVLGNSVQDKIPNRYFTGLQTYGVKRMGSLVADIVYLLSDQFEREMGQVWNTNTCAAAAQLGWLDCLTFLHENGCAWDELTCSGAAENGKLDCLKYAHTHGCPWSARTSNAALQNRHMECFQYARDGECPWDQETCAEAANRQDVSLLKFLHEAGCPWDAKTTQNATFYGNNNIMCLQYAFVHGCPWDEKTCSNATFGGNLAALTFAHENGCPWDKHTCRQAAYNKALSCLQYAHTHGCPWDEDTTSEAASSGSLECLKYARERGCPWDQRVVEYAAHFGNLDCLQYALENGCPGRDKACFNASGQLSCLQYAREHQDCPWDVSVVNRCTETYYGSEECLEYCLLQGCPANEDTAQLCATRLRYLKLARERGCPWDKRTMHTAAQQGQLDCLEYTLDNGCPGVEEVILHAAHQLVALQFLHARRISLVSGAYARTVEGDQSLECVRFLFENGCAWGTDSCTAFARHHLLDCLTFARENGAPWDESTSAAAAHLNMPDDETLAEHNKALECLRYLRNQGCPWDVNTCVTAADSGNLLCLQYAHEHGCPWDFRVYRAAERGWFWYPCGKMCLKYVKDHRCPWWDPHEVAFCALAFVVFLGGFFSLVWFFSSKNCATVSCTETERVTKFQNKTYFLNWPRRWQPRRTSWWEWGS